MESNSLKCSSIQMVRSIELKFGTDHRPTSILANLGFFFFTGVKERTYT